MRRFKFALKMRNGDVLEDVKSVGDTPDEAYSRLMSNDMARSLIDFDSVVSVEYEELPYSEVNPDNYRFEKSKQREGWYVVTDLRRLIVTIFPHGDFNSAQRHVQLEDKNSLSVSDMATAMRELGEYLYIYHKAEVGA